MRASANKLDEKRAAQLLAQGLTHTVIAQRLGVAVSTIHHFMLRQKRKQNGG